MLEIETILAPLAVSAAAMLAISLAFFAARKKSRARTRDLAVAAAALEDHFDAFETFMSDPASPRSLKLLLLKWSDIVADRAASERAFELIVRHVTAEAASSADAGSDALIRELHDLRAHRADLADAFNLAIGAGVVVFLFRWAEPHSMVDQVIARVSTDARKLSLAVRATRDSNGGIVEGLQPA